MASLPGDMKPGLAALKREGTVLIEVPDPVSAPTDLYVIDHCHHYLPSALDRSLALSGLVPTGDELSGLIAGETTRVYKRSAAKVTPSKKIQRRSNKLH